jgi:NitT/TauT family transport system permease protein
MKRVGRYEFLSDSGRPELSALTLDLKGSVSMLRRWLGKLGAGSEKAIAILVVALIWELLPRIGLVNDFVLPPFSQVAARLALLLISGTLLPHIAISLERVFWGFALSVAVGVPAGFLMGWSKPAERIFDPLVQLFRNTATLALYPLFILILGLGEYSKIAIIFWGAVWPVLINSIESVKAVEPLLVKSARSMGASWPVLFGKVILPSAFPAIFTGIRLSASRAIIILVAAEMLGSDRGLGYFIFRSEQIDQIAEMYAGLITLVILGVLINYLLVGFEKRITRWKEEPVGV